MDEAVGPSQEAAPAAERMVPMSCQIPESLGEWLEAQARLTFGPKSSVVRQILDRARRESLVLDAQGRRVPPAA
jgi:hypothetical protein